MPPFVPPQPDFSGVGSLAPNPAPLDLSGVKMKRRGMFGNADWGSAISAALNGYLAAGGNPAGISGLQQLHQQKMMEQQQALAAQQYAQHRADDNADWMNHYKFELDNPKPYRWESNDGSLMEMGPDGTPRVVYKDPTPKPNWIQVRDPATGELRIVNMGTVGGQTEQPEILDTLPPGAKPLGGAGGNASGGFPGY
jgi:hypothetical protein